LFINDPIGITRAVVGKHRCMLAVGPSAESRAGHRDEVFDDGRSENFKEEVFVRLRIAPSGLRFLFELRPGANGDENSAASTRSVQRVAKPGAVKRDTIDDHGIVFNTERVDTSRVDPRVSVSNEPFAGAFGKLQRPSFERKTTRVP